MGAAATIQRALKAVEMIQEAYNKAWPLALIAEAQAKNGDIDGALKTAETIQDAYNKAWSLALIAEAQAENGDIDGALKNCRNNSRCL